MRRGTLVLGGLVLLGALLWFEALAAPGAGALGEAAPRAQDAVLQPVEVDPHEFMEYVNEPVFDQLKTALVSEPKDGQAWKPVKSAALLLAESGNLLLLRPPDDAKAENWNKQATLLREVGARLYEAGKQKNYAEARKHYAALVERCNACHGEFSAGEPKIEP